MKPASDRREPPAEMARETAPCCRTAGSHPLRLGRPQEHTCLEYLRGYPRLIRPAECGLDHGRDGCGFAASAEAESHSPDRGQELFLGCVAELPAEISNVHVHHVALRVEVHVPDFLQQRRAQDHLFGVEEEIL